MAFLSILFLLFSFVFLGVGSGSTSTTGVPQGSSSSSRSTACIDVTWRKGHPARLHRCHGTTRAHVAVHHRATIKCSGRMPADGQTRQRCGPPPANP